VLASVSECKRSQMQGLLGLLGQGGKLGMYVRVRATQNPWVISAMLCVMCYVLCAGDVRALLTAAS
jgi:hypothetical protein